MFEFYGDINPLMTNGFTHRYNLDESTFILGASGVILIFLNPFFDEITLSKQNSQRCDAAELGSRVLRRHIWGYTVCLCPTKWTPGLYELIERFTRNISAASWENQQFAYAKTKAQISFAVTAKLISAFVFATRIVYYKT